MSLMINPAGDYPIPYKPIQFPTNLPGADLSILPMVGFTLLEKTFKWFMIHVNDSMEKCIIYNDTNVTFKEHTCFLYCLLTI